MDEGGGEEEKTMGVVGRIKGEAESLDIEKDSKLARQIPKFKKRQGFIEETGGPKDRRRLVKISPQDINP